MSLVNFNNNIINLSSNTSVSGAGTTFKSLKNFTLNKGLYIISSYVELIPSVSYQGGSLYIIQYGLSSVNNGFSNDNDTIKYSIYSPINFYSSNKIDIIEVLTTENLYMNLLLDSIDPSTINFNMSIKKIY